MKYKWIALGIIFLGALLALGLGFYAVLDAAGVSPLLPSWFTGATPWPQSNPGPVRAISAQPAGNPAPAPVAWPSLYVLNIARPRFAAQLLAQTNVVRAVAVPRPAPTMTDAPGRRFQIATGQPVQLVSSHLSPNLLTALSVTVNGQPVGPAATDFPARLLDVQLCTPAVERIGVTAYATFCPPHRVTRAGSINLAQAATSHYDLALILTGHTPGTYQLEITATDTDNNTSKITHIIEVVSNPS